MSPPPIWPWRGLPSPMLSVCLSDSHLPCRTFFAGFGWTVIHFRDVSPNLQGYSSIGVTSGRFSASKFEPHPRQLAMTWVVSSHSPLIAPGEASAQVSLCVLKGGLKHSSFHFVYLSILAVSNAVPKFSISHYMLFEM